MRVVRQRHRGARGTYALIYNDVVHMTQPGFSIVHNQYSIALQGGLYMGVAA